jgi:hypothetical protein
MSSPEPAGDVARRGLWPWLLVLVFALHVAFVTAHHEPWFDEAQSWLLARDSSLWQLLTERMRYEGTPALWHLLLWVPAHLGVPYRAVSVIGATCAVAGAVVIALRAPFPLWVRAAVLFTFVVGYQYAVVARSYNLFPLLLFTAAALHPSRWTHPWRYVGALVLLATVSVHGTLVAAGLLGVHGCHLIRRRAEVANLRVHVSALAAFALVVGLIALQLRPPPDLVVGAATNLDPGNAIRTAADVLDNAFTGRGFLTLGVLLGSAWWFRHRRVLLLWAVPTVLLLLLAGVKYNSYWHDGMVFLVWFFAYWVAERRVPTDRQDRSLARVAGATAMVVVLVVQVGWWVNSALYDLRRTYSASDQAAAYLQERGLADGEVVAAGFHSIAILPYFEDNIFDNLNQGRPPAFYVWSSSPPLVETRERLSDPDADVIVWGIKFPWQQQVPVFEGYDRTAEFTGGLFWKDRVVEPDTYIIFERRPSAS